MDNATAWAHVRIDAATGRPIPHLLADHLGEVARRAGDNAAGFGREWAYLAGLWHDIGKQRAGFQSYIRRANGIEAHIEGRVPDRDKTHSAAGAIWAERLLTERFGNQGAMMARALQYAIAGHHAGLDNWHGGLAERLASADAQRECDEALAAGDCADVLRPAGLPTSIRSLPVGDERVDIPGRFALWQRMLFSALVDADFLDTEAFYGTDRGSARGVSPPVSALKAALDEHLTRLEADAVASPVNRLRSDVLREDAMLLFGMAINIVIPPGLPHVLADRDTLKSCIANLVGNAAKYARTGAWIGITAQIQEASGIALTISDRGPGIDHQELSHVFEPFYRGSDARARLIPGAGLGLHLVRRRMESLQGRVTINSVPGQGCAVTLHLRSISV